MRYIDNNIMYTLYVEALNLYSKDPIIDSIRDILRDKGVDDSRVAHWFERAIPKYIESSDEGNHKGFTVVPHTYREGEPEWTKQSVEFTRTPEWKDMISHAIDYINSRDEEYKSKIVKKTGRDVLEVEIPQWDDELKSKPADTSDVIEGKDYKVLKSYDKGYKIVHITSQQCGKREGNIMGHCAGGYDPTKLISLWDSKNVPHVTLELANDGSIHQIKGTANTRPLQKYVPYVIDFIKSGNYEVTGDGDNIGMVEWDNKFYFRDSDKFKELYERVIVPKQKAAIADVMSRITTVNESYSHVLNYL